MLLALRMRVSDEDIVTGEKLDRILEKTVTAEADAPAPVEAEVSVEVPLDPETGLEVQEDAFLSLQVSAEDAKGLGLKDGIKVCDGSFLALRDPDGRVAGQPLGLSPAR